MQAPIRRRDESFMQISFCACFAVFWSGRVLNFDRYSPAFCIAFLVASLAGPLRADEPPPRTVIVIAGDTEAFAGTRSLGPGRPGANPADLAPPGHMADGSAAGRMG